MWAAVRKRLSGQLQPTVQIDAPAPSTIPPGMTSLTEHNSERKAICKVDEQPFIRLTVDGMVQNAAKQANSKPVASELLHWLLVGDTAEKRCVAVNAESQPKQKVATSALPQTAPGSPHDGLVLCCTCGVTVLCSPQIHQMQSGMVWSNQIPSSVKVSDWCAWDEGEQRMVLAAFCSSCQELLGEVFFEACSGPENSQQMQNQVFPCFCTGGALSAKDAPAYLEFAGSNSHVQQALSALITVGDYQQYRPHGNVLQATQDTWDLIRSLKEAHARERYALEKAATAELERNAEQQRALQNASAARNANEAAIVAKRQYEAERRLAEEAFQEAAQAAQDCKGEHQRAEQHLIAARCAHDEATAAKHQLAEQVALRDRERQRAEQQVIAARRAHEEALVAKRQREEEKRSAEIALEAAENEAKQQAIAAHRAYQEAAIAKRQREECQRSAGRAHEEALVAKRQREEEKRSAEIALEAAENKVKQQAIAAHRANREAAIAKRQREECQRSAENRLTATGVAIQFQWLDDKGHWRPYESRIQAALESAYMRASSHTFNMGRCRYVVDFDLNVQVNVKTQKERPVRQVPSVDPAKANIKTPPYWTSTASQVQYIDVTAEIGWVVQRLLNDTFEGDYARSRHNNRGPHTWLKVTKVQRVENKKLWALYASTRETVQDATQTVQSIVCQAGGWPWQIDTDHKMDPTWFNELGLLGRKNEHLLFHGLPADAAEIVARDGFDERVSNLNGLFGSGIYFADAASKSEEYSGAGLDGLALFLSRVTLGMPFCARTESRGIRRPPCAQHCAMERCGHRRYDSIYSDGRVCARSIRNREFVIFDRNLAYPEFWVTFTRCT